MADAQSYHDGLIAQGYTLEQAKQYTQQYYPEFGLPTQNPTDNAPVTNDQTAIHDSSAPPIQQPAIQQPVMQQPAMQQPAIQQPVIQQSELDISDSGGKTKLIVAVAIGILILGSVLYVWQDNLADTYDPNIQPEFVGKWVNSDDSSVWVEFKSDGTACDHEDGCAASWKASGSTLELTFDDGAIATIDWSIDNGALNLEFTNVKFPNGSEYPEDELPTFSYETAKSAIVGNWTFCLSVCALENPDHVTYNVTFANGGTLIHPSYPVPPWQSATWSTDGSNIEWKISNQTGYVKLTGQYEIKNDVLFIAFDKIITPTQDGEENVTQTASAGMISVNTGLVINSENTKSAYTDILSNNTPYPEWFVEYLELADYADAQQDESTRRVFTPDDAAATTSVGSDDDLLYVTMSQADIGINWAYVKISISVDDEPPTECSNPGQDNSSADCQVTGDDDTTWTVGDSVVISESGYDLCSSECSVEITLYDISEDTVMQIINVQIS